MSERTTKKILIIASVIFFLVRLPFLDQIFLLHDERDAVLSGYSIAKTGKDMFGNTFPLSFENISPNNPLFAIYYSAFWSIFSPLTVFWSRIPYVFISTFLVFFVYGIIFYITKDKVRSLLTSILFCFNPWVFHLTRLALDISLAIVFLTAGILCYFKNRKILSYLLFFLSFFTYQGFRLLIPFLLIYLELYQYLEKKNISLFFVNTLKNIVYVLILLFLAFKIDPAVTSSRINEIIFFNPEKNAEQVIFRRNTSIAPAFLQKIFSNKVIVPLDYVLTNFSKALDPSFLFKVGDDSAINGNAISGQFFYVLILFYFLGIVSLGRKAIWRDVYLLGFIPLGIVPTLLSVHGASFSIRGMLSAVGYSYLLTLGFFYMFQLINLLKSRKYIIGFFILGLSVNIIIFLYGYYARRPVTVGELFNENEKQLSQFIHNNSNKQFTVYHEYPKDLFLSLVMTSDDKFLPIQEAQKILRNAIPYTWKGYSFRRCDKKSNYFTMSQVIVSEKCLEEEIYKNVIEDIRLKKLRVGQIFYKDYSLKTAYFIIE